MNMPLTLDQLHRDPSADRSTKDARTALPQIGNSFYNSSPYSQPIRYIGPYPPFGPYPPYTLDYASFPPRPRSNHALRPSYSLEPSRDLNPSHDLLSQHHLQVHEADLDVVRPAGVLRPPVHDRDHGEERHRAGSLVNPDRLPH